MALHQAVAKLKRSWAVPALVLVTVAGIVVINLNHEFYFRLVQTLATAWESAVLSFDYGTITLLNRFAHRSWSLDQFFFLIDANSLATFPLLLAFWWYWFKEGEEQQRNREIALYGVCACFFAVACARLLAVSLPFRERPLRNPLLDFQLPYGVRPERLLGWSSFPSDHSALWFALAATIFFISRRAGIFLSLYVIFGLALARIYVGTHYPTDILAGGLIGIAVASLVRHPSIREAVTRKPLQWMNNAPHLFYPCLFLATAQMTEGFTSARDLYVYLRAVASAAARVLGAS